MLNTQIEAQYYSKLLMLTPAAFVDSGFNPASTTPVNPTDIKPNTSAIRALYAGYRKYENLDALFRRTGYAPRDIRRLSHDEVRRLFDELTLSPWAPNQIRARMPLAGVPRTAPSA